MKIPSDMTLEHSEHSMVHAEAGECIGLLFNNPLSPTFKHVRRSDSSSCSTPWDVLRAREERDVLEAAKMARLTARIDRHERKKHEKRQKKKKSSHH